MPLDTSTTYVFASRLDAARFAAKIRQAGNQNTGRFSVAWSQLKSGLTRTVRLMPPSTVSEYNALNKIKKQLKELEGKSLCTRKPTIYDLPADFKWSTGQAKIMNSQVVVRSWMESGDLSSVRHSSLSIKEKSSNLHEYVSWIPDKSTSIKPVKSNHDDESEGFFSSIKGLYHNMFSKTVPDTDYSYRREKHDNITESAIENIRKALQPGRK